MTTGEHSGTRGVTRLLDVVNRLRGEGGCPWDREQTLESLKRYLIEESYEVLDAVDSGDPAKHKEELGDVLLQVALHARIRQEQGAFTFDDVADALADKLIRRHPHVFADVKVEDSGQVLRNWEVIKAGEREQNGGGSALDGVPRHLPALQKAAQVQSRAARAGFDWEHVRDVAAKVDEELAELREAMAHGDAARITEEVGDVLFSVVNLCRFLHVHPEEALEKTTARFAARFREVERSVAEQGRRIKDCSSAELDACWEAAKAKAAATADRPSNSAR